MKRKTPDLALLDDVVSDKVLGAMRVASARLRELGVRHVLVGALAVGAHGYPRATRDVDFLVGDEAFEHHEGGVVTLKPGVPIQVGGVIVDHLSATPEEPYLADALPPADASPEVPIASAAVVVYLKLRSSRLRDKADVVELLKSGLEAPPCRAYLTAHAPDLLRAFDELVEEAAREDAAP